MSKITKTIAALGVVAGLGVAALPLASYADTKQTITVNAQLDQTLSVGTPTQATVTIPVTNNAEVAQGSTSVTVTTNNDGGYTLNIKDADGTTTLADGDNNIPAGKPTQGVSAWAYKGGDTADWTKITESDVALKTTDAPTSNTGEAVEISFGVTAAANQAAGTYTGAVTVTAVAN